MVLDEVLCWLALPPPLPLIPNYLLLLLAACSELNGTKKMWKV